VPATKTGEIVAVRRPGLENAHPAVAALKPSIAETDDSACLIYSAGRKRL